MSRPPIETLIAAAQTGDSDSMSTLVEQNTPLIWSVVRRFSGRGVEQDDLFQLGSIGFIKAVQGFDLSFGTQFSTYAVPKIMGEIQRFLRDDGMIKVSRSVKEHAARVAAVRVRFEKEQGREPRLSELCAQSGLSEEEVLLCQQAHSEATSLDGAQNEDGFSLADVLSEGDQEGRMVEYLALRDAIEALEPRQKAVLVLRYFRDMTQQKTAQVLDMSQVQVSRMEKKACQLIRQYMQT